MLYDPLVDKDRDGKLRALIDKLRATPGMDEGVEPRVKGKGKGKDSLLRYAGEVAEDEQEPVIRDPRKLPGFKKLPNMRPGRPEFYELCYEVRSALPPVFRPLMRFSAARHVLNGPAASDGRADARAVTPHPGEGRSAAPVTIRTHRFFRATDRP